MDDSNITIFDNNPTGLANTFSQFVETQPTGPKKPRGKYAPKPQKKEHPNECVVALRAQSDGLYLVEEADNEYHCMMYNPYNADLVDSSEYYLNFGITDESETREIPSIAVKDNTNKSTATLDVAKPPKDEPPKKQYYQPKKKLDITIDEELIEKSRKSERKLPPLNLGKKLPKPPQLGQSSA